MIEPVIYGLALIGGLTTISNLLRFAVQPIKTEVSIPMVESYASDTSDTLPMVEFIKFVGKNYDSFDTFMFLFKEMIYKQTHQQPTEKQISMLLEMYHVLDEAYDFKTKNVPRTYEEYLKHEEENARVVAIIREIDACMESTERE